MKKIILNRVRKCYPNYMKYFALIDDEDYERVNKHNWNIAKRGNTMYAESYINGKKILLHIFIMGFVGIDHKDMNGLNCQKSNLRKATKQENNMNRISNQNSTSKFKGVSWNKWAGKWTAQIIYNRIKIHLGYFTSETEAAERYNVEAKKLFGEFARLNCIRKL